MTEDRSITRRDLLGGLAAAAAAAAIPQTAHAGQGVPLDVDALLAQTGVPSIAFARVEGERITTEAHGTRRARSTTGAVPGAAGSAAPEPATADTVYAAASLTKMVVAWTLLDLVQDGALALDQPLREIVPHPNPEDPHAGAITARRLLSHSGGWANWRFNAQQRLASAFEPGTRWQYSGEGFFHLQRVAERITGRPFPRLVRDRVLDPLGMARSSLVLLESLEPHLAAGHGGRGDPVQPFGRPILLELRRAMAARGLTHEDATVEDAEQALRVAEPNLAVLPNFLAPNAAASLVTTANDFARFVRHVATARAAGGRAAAIAALLMQPQVRCNAAIQWGLGVGLERVGDRDHAWQWGDNPGYKNYCAIDPVGGTGFVVFTNGDRGARVYERLVRARTGTDRPGFLWS